VQKVVIISQVSKLVKKFHIILDAKEFLVTRGPVQSDLFHVPAQPISQFCISGFIDIKISTQSSRVKFHNGTWEKLNNIENQSGLCTVRCNCIISS
jgi:hypothetical protein